jgi:phosphate transport system protein
MEGLVEARLHTDRHYEAELKELHLKILEMGGFVEKQIATAMTALIDRDDELARLTIDRDHTANRMDVQIDDLCLRLLALHQPAAKDLRLITTALKITTDLERIGDMAVNMCERALELNQEPQLKPFIDLPRMVDVGQAMLRESLNAFVHEDVELALKVCRDDDIIDGLNGQLFRELLSYMMEDPHTITRAIRLLFIAKYVERIADHATNIAEMVVFMVKGKSIRHLDQVPPSV